MGDHQDRHIEDRDPISRGQFACVLGKLQQRRVDVVGYEVCDADDIEGDNEEPEEGTHPEGQKREQGKQAGGEIAISGDRRETLG